MSTDVPTKEEGGGWSAELGQLQGKYGVMYDSPLHSIKTHPGPPKSNVSSSHSPQYRRNMTKIKPKTLDGCTLEGGGQLIRIAVALSAITSK